MNRKGLKSLVTVLLLALTSIFGILFVFRNESDASANEEEISLEIIDVEENNNGLKVLVIEISNHSQFELTDNMLNVYSGVNENEEETTNMSQENQTSGSSSSSREDASKITTLDGLFDPLQPETTVRVELSVPESIEIEEAEGLRFRSTQIRDVEHNQRYSNPVIKKVPIAF